MYNQFNVTMNRYDEQNESSYLYIMCKFDGGKASNNIQLYFYRREGGTETPVRCLNGQRKVCFLYSAVKCKALTNSVYIFERLRFNV